MTQTPNQSRPGWRCAHLRLSLALLCVLAVGVSGCAERSVKVKTFPWSTVAMVRPKPLRLPPAPGDDAADASPERQLGVPPPPSPLVTVHSMPQRPRVPTVSSGQNDSARPEAPQIVPQLTPEETRAAQQQTTVSISIAERNIVFARGKPLNVSQLDLASKVRSFIAEAREAAHVGDWTRARNAAKKAQVLSEELARSL